jgi:1-deoxy-D-xylulose-5-phosphate reductoisomerase
MKTPIAYALSYPERLPLNLPFLDLCSLGSLTFKKPDLNRFECLCLAYEALREGGTAPAVLNAANEVAVEAFLNGKIDFLNIPSIIRTTLERHQSNSLQDINEVLRADRWGRDAARRIIETTT